MATVNPTTARPSVCPLDCPDTCSLEVEVDGGRATRVGATRANPLTDGFLCSKVRDFAAHVYHAERVAHPLVRAGAKGEGAFRRASWDQALDLVAGRLRAIREEHGGDAILPLAYGGSNGLLTDRAIDELLFARLGACRLLRTICAAPTGIAAAGLYGRMPGVAFEDYAEARLVVVWGTNPHATGIHLVPHVRRARAAGARLCVVDPRTTPLARTADLHVAPRPGTDLVVALALHRELFESGAADLEFLARHATGFEELRARARPWTIERAAEVSGVPAADLERFARLYAESSPAVIRCGYGLERNRNGASAAAAILALPAVAGKFGVRGGGYTMSNGSVFDLRSSVRDADGFGRTMNLAQAGRALCEADPPVRAAVIYNLNPLQTLPRRDLVRRGLAREDLFTVVIEQVMTDTALYADVVLPATTFLEHHELKRGYGAPWIALSEPAIDPVGEARPNYAIFRDLARRLGVWRAGDPETPEQMVANALEADRDAAHGIARAGSASPAIPRPVQMVDALPRTRDGRIHLCPGDLDRAAPGGLYFFQPDPASADAPLALISPATSRAISSSLGQLYHGIEPLHMHPDDARARGLVDGERVRVHNAFGEAVTRLAVTDRVRPGTVSLAKGLWARHTLDGNGATALAPDTLTDLGGGACYNDARVEVTRARRDEGDPPL